RRSRGVVGPVDGGERDGTWWETNVDSKRRQVMDAETEKPTVKTFQDDIGVLNALNRLSSKGVPKESLHLFAHDEQRTDCLVGEGVGTDVGDLDDLVADRYNESGDELRQIFRRFGFGDEEADDLETKLQDGTILLLIDEARRL